MKLVILILIVLQTTAYAVENAPGDFLRFRFSALTQVSQMRIITKPRINFDGDIPTAWEGDSCVDDTENVWLPYPMNDNSLCCRNEDLDGFMLWVSSNPRVFFFEILTPRYISNCLSTVPAIRNF